MNIDFNPIIQFLNDMAEKLTPTAQRVFELAVRQTMVDGLLGLIAWLFFLVVAILSWRMVLVTFKMLGEEVDYEKIDNLEIAQIVFCLIAIASIIVLLCGTFIWIPNAVNAFLNPEYQTLLKLLQLIK